MQKKLGIVIFFLFFYASLLQANDQLLYSIFPTNPDIELGFYTAIIPIKGRIVQAHKHFIGYFVSGNPLEEYRKISLVIDEFTGQTKEELTKPVNEVPDEILNRIKKAVNEVKLGTTLRRINIWMGPTISPHKYLSSKILMFGLLREPIPTEGDLYIRVSFVYNKATKKVIDPGEYEYILYVKSVEGKNVNDLEDKFKRLHREN